MSNQRESVQERPQENQEIDTNGQEVPISRQYRSVSPNINMERVQELVRSRRQSASRLQETTPTNRTDVLTRQQQEEIAKGVGKLFKIVQFLYMLSWLILITVFVLFLYSLWTKIFWRRPEPDIEDDSNQNLSGYSEAIAFLFQLDKVPQSPRISIRISSSGFPNAVTIWDSGFALTFDSPNTFILSIAFSISFYLIMRYLHRIVGKLVLMVMCNDGMASPQRRSALLIS